MFITWGHSFIEPDLADTDNIVVFDTTVVNQNKKGQNKKNAKQSDQINRSGILNGTLLSMSDKSDLVNKCTQEINQLI